MNNTETEKEIQQLRTELAAAQAKLKHISQISFHDRHDYAEVCSRIGQFDTSALDAYVARERKDAAEQTLHACDQRLTNSIAEAVKPYVELLSTIRDFPSTVTPEQIDALLAKNL